MRGRAVAVLLGVAGCSTTSTFPCASDESCVRDGEQGVCAGPGFCAFEDGDCDSGLKYGELAGGGLAGTCVEVQGTTTDSPADDTAPPTTVAAETTQAVADATDGGDTVAGTVNGSASTATDAHPGDSSGAPCPPDWWDCAWSHRRALEIGFSGTPQADFPLLVALDAERIDLDVVRVGGGDLRFVMGGELLAHESSGWESGGAREAWVRVPELAEGSSLHMYYGNPAAPNVSSPAEVWTNGYLAVMHMLDESEVLGALQMSANDVEATPSEFGDGLQFNGQSAFLQDQGPPIDLFNQGATMTVKFNASGWGQGGFGRLVDASDINTTATGYSVALSEDGDDILAGIRVGHGFEDNRGTWASGQNSVTLEHWSVAAVAYDNDPTASPAIWIDGEPSGPSTVSTPGGGPVAAPTPLTVGALGDASIRFFDGVIDEVHIATVIRSSDWARAEYASLSDQLLSFGPEESL